MNVAAWTLASALRRSARERSASAVAVSLVMPGQRVVGRADRLTRSPDRSASPMIRAERQFVLFELIGGVRQPLFGGLPLHLRPDGVDLRRDFILDAIGRLLVEFAG